MPGFDAFGEDRNCDDDVAQAADESKHSLAGRVFSITASAGGPRVSELNPEIPIG